jgi:hypothetical protein
MDRALRHAGLRGDPAVSSGALAAARWLPEVRVGAAVTRAQLPTGSRDETEIYGLLTWPLGRGTVGAARDELRNDRWRVTAKTDLLDRITATWHRRAQADRIGDEVAAELELEEADAELDALTGDALEDQP